MSRRLCNIHGFNVSIQGHDFSIGGDIINLEVSAKDHETDIPEVQVERAISLYKTGVEIQIETVDANHG